VSVVREDAFARISICDEGIGSIRPITSASSPDSSQ